MVSGAFELKAFCTVTGVVCLDLLEQHAFPRIETFELETVSRVIVMQDGAPPHFSRFVTDILNERLPDALSPFDFFSPLWGVH